MFWGSGAISNHDCILCKIKNKVAKQIFEAPSLLVANLVAKCQLRIRLIHPYLRCSRKRKIREVVRSKNPLFGHSHCKNLIDTVGCINLKKLRHVRRTDGFKCVEFAPRWENLIGIGGYIALDVPSKHVPKQPSGSLVLIVAIMLKNGMSNVGPCNATARF